MRVATLFVAGLATLALTACASKPKPSISTPSETPPAAGPVTELPPTPAAPSLAPVPGSQADLAATAGERVYFAFDSFSLDADASAILGQQAAWLARHGEVRVGIEGHADERGTREYNLALGARRAAAVRQALINQGISPARLETLSFGKERPLDPGSTEAAMARNRNAHTVVIGFSGR